MHSFLSRARAAFKTRLESPLDAQVNLARSYQRVFLGSATSDDQAAVLVDLADYTGFYRVTAPDSGGRDALVFNEGMRAAYGRIFSFLRMPPDEIAQLETAARDTAARRQALASNQPQE